MSRRGGRRAVIAFVVILAAACTTRSGTTATPPGAPGCLPARAAEDVLPQATSTLAAIQAVTADEVWAVGAGRIVHTPDGGRTWERQYAGLLEPSSVFFRDVTHGWVTAGDQLLATDDGGRCWTVRAQAETEFRAVHFADHDVGWAVVRDDSFTPGWGGLARTTDGGRTWTGVDAPLDVKAVCLEDRAVGWIAAGGLHRTADAGRTWERVDVRGDPVRVQCAAGGAWAMTVLGAAVGFTDHAFYRIRNGEPPVPILMADSVFPRGVDAPVAEGSHPVALSMIDPSAAVLVSGTPALGGENTKVAIALDAGRELRRPGTPVSEVVTARDVAFTSADNGWVIGYAATREELIVHTGDGGRSWHVQFRTPSGF